MRKTAARRNTKGRQEILRLLKDTGNPVTALFIFNKLKDGGAVKWQSTVYRALNCFVETGEVLRTVSTDGTAYFQYNRHEHVHRMICNKCHHMTILDHCPISEFSSLFKDMDFEIESHKLEFYGTCKNCRNKKN